MDTFSIADVSVLTADLPIQQLIPAAYTGQLCWREQLILSAMILPFISLLQSESFLKKVMVFF
jgi:hypothetical protein